MTKKSIKNLLVFSVPAVLLTVGITSSIITHNAKADGISSVEKGLYNLEQAIQTIDLAKTDEPVLVVND